MDVTPENSLAIHSNLPGLIVLRSLGKFFGLAGTRVGFVLAQTNVLELLANLLGPWTIAGPSRYIACQALADRQWQSKMRVKLVQQGRQLQNLLTQYQLQPSGGCSLFQWVRLSDSARIAEHFRQQGILVREFTQPASLRFGLPANASQWQRLEKSLKNITETQSA